jgi:ATP-dependent DNA helicase RecQ
MNRWSRLLMETWSEWAGSVGDASVPVFVIRETFADSMAERRRTHRTGDGVVLATAHKAKGLEFPHVFIADGGWKLDKSPSKTEEERRTYYVAMTRAQETLTLLSRRDCRNPFLRDVSGEHVIDRAFRGESVSTEWTAFACRQYSTLSPSDLFISYAATFADDSPARQALQRAQADDPVALVARNNQIVIETRSGIPIAQLSAAGRKTWWDRLADVDSAKIIALVQRRSDEDARPHSPDEPVSQWEYPLVEVTWTPSKRAHASMAGQNRACD